MSKKAEEKTERMDIPYITTQQMVEVDRLLIKEYGFQLIQVMENAGRNLAELSRRMLDGDLSGKRIAILCGSGNNGGGGMAAARHLHNWGADISLKLLAPIEKLKSAPAIQFSILKEMGISNKETIDLDLVDLIIDAMIGYGLTGDPHGAIADWIRRVNVTNHTVLALDAPSGLNTTTGIPGNPSVHASATLTLALPKTGLSAPGAAACVGDLYLADIGVPPELYAAPSLGLFVSPIFVRDTIIRLER